MLHWTSEVTCNDHIRNEDIRDRCAFAPIVEKLGETRHTYFAEQDAIICII